MRRYTIGAFAKKAGVSTHMLRHYDRIGLMKPSAISEGGYRLYSDADFKAIQKITALRWLDLSLDDIQKIIRTEQQDEIYTALRIRKKTILNEIEHLQQITRAIDTMERQEIFQWQHLLDLIQMLRIQNGYMDQQAHINRANLHRFSTNPERWHSFLFRQMKISRGQRILELDARDGQLWIDNAALLPNCHLTQSVSKRTYVDHLRTVMNEAQWQHPCRFDYAIIPLDRFWLPERSYDVIVANHLYMRIADLDTVLQACSRALKPGGRLFCAAIGENHMSELLDLAQSYDSNIHFDRMDTLKQFAMDNGAARLGPYFRQVEWNGHPDEIVTDDPQLIFDYLMCNYSNMQALIKNRTDDLLGHIRRQIRREGMITIHKEHGVFCASRPVG